MQQEELTFNLGTDAPSALPDQAPAIHLAAGSRVDGARGAEPPDEGTDLTALTAPTTARQPLLLTVRDVEAELQLGRTRTYELVRSGALPVLRVGRSIRVPREALLRWIEDHCATGVAR